MATHSSILAWRIPGMEEPGGLQAMGSQKVAYTRIGNWRRRDEQDSLTSAFMLIIGLQGEGGRCGSIRCVMWGETQCMAVI